MVVSLSFILPSLSTFLASKHFLISFASQNFISTHLSLLALTYFWHLAVIISSCQTPITKLLQTLKSSFYLHCCEGHTNYHNATLPWLRIVGVLLPLVPLPCSSLKSPCWEKIISHFLQPCRKIRCFDVLLWRKKRYRVKINDFMFVLLYVFLYRNLCALVEHCKTTLFISLNNNSKNKEKNNEQKKKKKKKGEGSATTKASTLCLKLLSDGHVSVPPPPLQPSPNTHGCLPRYHRRHGFDIG